MDQTDGAVAFFDMGIGSMAVADRGSEIVEVAPAQLVLGPHAANRLTPSVDDFQLAALAEHHPAVGAIEFDARIAVVRIIRRPEPHLERKLARATVSGSWPFPNAGGGIGE